MASCTLALTLPKGSKLTDGREMASWLWDWDQLPPEQLADSLEKVYNLGGRGDLYEVNSIRHEERGGFVGLNARQAILGHIGQISEDLKSAKESSDGRCFELLFDPQEWFEGDKEFFEFASGRLYWLAASGVLERFGFEVSGSDL